MLNNKSLTTIFLLSFCYLISLSQESALKLISTKDLRRHLSFIASDSLQGRSFDTPVNGLEIASEYLKKQIMELGLKPGVKDYFQTVPLIQIKPDFSNSFVELKDQKGKTVLKTDSVVTLTSEDKFSLINAEIIFAGFGYTNGQTGYDDFKGLDLTGKVVMFSMGFPELFLKKEKAVWNNQFENAKIKRAKDAGAACVIIADSPFDEGNLLFNRIKQWRSRSEFRPDTAKDIQETTNTLFLSVAQANALLGKKNKLNKLLSEIAGKNQPQSFVIPGRKVNVKINKNTRHIYSKNVIGMVEGSDPVLKNECVVFMAHYDHIGIGKNGDVFNGADDNGSGTVTLIEVAKAFRNQEPKPKRSVVFLWVTAEEIGLFGSKYYAEHPVFPMDKTALCINIDMDGRVYEPRDSVWKSSPKLVKDFDGLYTLTNNISPEIKEINSEVCQTLGLIPDYSLPASFLRTSDHYSFHSKGVPILNYATGYHADYHKESDEISRINFDKMKRVADLCFLVGLTVANEEKPVNSNNN